MLTMLTNQQSANGGSRFLGPRFLGDHLTIRNKTKRNETPLSVEVKVKAKAKVLSNEGVSKTWGMPPTVFFDTPSFGFDFDFD